MTKEISDWWKGLGKDLQTDIETFLDNTKEE